MRPSFTQLVLDDSLDGDDDDYDSDNGTEFAEMNIQDGLKENQVQNVRREDGVRKGAKQKLQSRRPRGQSNSRRRPHSRPQPHPRSRQRRMQRRPSQSRHLNRNLNRNSNRNHENKQPQPQPQQQKSKLRVVRSVKQARRMDWQNSRPVIVSSRGAGTGLFAQPSHHAQANGALTNRPMSRAEANAEAAAAREEVISMKIEHTAQASLVEMLTQRCARLGSQLERQRLDAKIMATKLKESEDHRERLLQSTEATGMRGSQLEEQVEILREELDTARRVDKEKEESLLMLSKALREAQAESREQTAQSNQDASEAEKFAEAERRRNAGLMQQLQQEQKRVVDMASRIRNLETQLQEKELEMSACLADVEAEKEWRERASREEGRRGAACEIAGKGCYPSWPSRR